jgi:aldehyde dehydrogenase (NAD+)
MYADGGWRSAHGERFDVFDPTDERVIGSIPAGSEADAEEVLASAQRAQAGGRGLRRRRAARICARWPT